MKLPGTTTMGVQSLGRENKNLALAAGRAEATAAMSISNTAKLIGLDIIEKDTERKIAEQQDYLARREGEITQEFKTKEFYTPDEIPEDIKVQRYRSEVDPVTGETFEHARKIPAHEVRAKLYEYHMGAAIKGAVEQVPNTPGRTKWEEGLSVYYEQANARHIENDFIKEQSYWNDKWAANYQQALANKEYQIARNNVDRMDISLEKKGEMLLGIDKTEEQDSYWIVLTDGTEEQVQGAIDSLTEKKYGGSLDEGERANWWVKLNGRLGDFEKAREAAHKTKVSALKEESRLMKENLKMGGFPMMDYNHVMSTVNALKDNGEDIEAARLLHEYNTGGMTTSMYKEPILGQINLAHDMKRLADKYPTNTRLQLMAQTAWNTMLTSQKEMNANLLDYVQKHQREAFEPLDIQNWDESLIRRLSAVYAYQHQYDMTGSAQGILTTSEVNEIGQALSNMPAPERMEFITRSVTLLGANEAYRFLEPLKMAGILPDIMVGARFQHSDPMMFSQIVRGSQVKDMMKKTAPEILTEANEHFVTGGFVAASWLHPEELLGVREAALSHYLSDPMNRDQFDADAFDESMIKIANIHEVNGRMLALPTAWDGDTAEDYMDNLHPRGIAEMGSPKDIDNTTLIKRLRDGSIYLEQLTSSHAFLIDANTGGYIMDKTTRDRFQFQFGEFTTKTQVAQQTAEKAQEDLKKNLGLKEFPPISETDLQKWRGEVAEGFKSGIGGIPIFAAGFEDAFNAVVFGGEK